MIVNAVVVFVRKQYLNYHNFFPFYKKQYQANFIKIKDLHRRPELIHILKTGFDLESDITKIESEANKLQQVTNSLLTFSHE